MTKIESLLNEYNEWKSNEPNIERSNLKDFGIVIIRPSDSSNFVITDKRFGDDRSLSMPLNAAQDLYIFLDNLFKEEKP